MLLRIERRLLYGPNCLNWAKKFQDYEPDQIIAPVGPVLESEGMEKERFGSSEVEKGHEIEQNRI